MRHCAGAATFGGLEAVADGAVRVEAVSTAGGQPLLVISRTSGEPIVLDARTRQLFHISPASLAKYAPRLVPHSRVIATETLTAPDAYWYETGSLPRLPVLRIRFGDPAATWVHISPRTGEVLGTMGDKGRTYRWLFDLLHKWDLNALTLRRPLWDIVLWSMSLLGLVTSISGIRIGWKRLRRGSGKPRAVNA
jgi:uncharacterized iron-regulated membrane protein